MVKVAQMSIPPEYAALLARILAYFDNQIYPTWAGRFFHKTRSAKKALKEKTYMPSAAAAWKLLTPTEKTAWAAAADFGALNRYQLFLADFSYRRKNGLSLPGTPYPLHEMMSLEIQNPGGLENVRLRRDEKDLVGPVGINFTYRKQEMSLITQDMWSDANVAWADAVAQWTGIEAAAWSDPNIDWSDTLARWAFSTTGLFHFVATAYYFEAGKNNIEVLSWSAPAGSFDWTQVTQSFGVSGRKYFHLTIIWYLDGYDALVDFDHLLITTNGVDKYRENWQFKAGKVWVYDNLYRKSGWLFSPDIAVPYFEVLYLN
jgi:hypothetical protein